MRDVYIPESGTERALLMSTQLFPAKPRLPTWLGYAAIAFLSGAAFAIGVLWIMVGTK
jgi:hypothetical protein